ncbi:MAG: PAS domain S-box protein [bacterium]|jgi:PAS domain S-box-containing protein
MTDDRRLYPFSCPAILVLAHSGEIIKANRRASSLLGAAIPELEGSHISRFLGGRLDFSQISAMISDDGSAGRKPISLTAADGATFDAHLSGLELPCACGGDTHIICALNAGDSTGHSVEPPESVVQPEDLADLLPEIVFEMDLDGKLTFVNQKGYELTGYTPEDFESGLKAVAIIAPRDRAAATRNISAILSGSTGGPHEYTAVRKDGTEFPVLIHSAPIYRDGKPAGLRGVIIDMTERKRAETDLRIVDSAMACSINAIAIADMEGRLTYVNAAFIRMWGYESEVEVMRRPVIEFWEMADKAREVVTALHRDGGWIGELVGRRRDGSTFEVDTAATLVTDKQGNPIRMMASFIDITNRKRAEREREQELMRREKLRGALEMAGAACHEFNQPMQVISGYAELLLRDRGETGPGSDELRRIKAASDRMIAISRKIQQITRYETREYVGGATIIDIDKSSCLKGPDEPLK